MSVRNKKNAAKYKNSQINIISSSGLSKYWLLLFMVFILLIPNNIIGEGLGSVILTLTGSLYLIFYKEKIKLNRNYMVLLFILFTFSLISLLFTNNLPKSLEGVTLYVNAGLFYIIFAKEKPYREPIFDISVYILSLSASFFIVYQGLILKTRIAGNIGYANTYALLLIIGLFFNELRIKTKFSSLIQILLYLGIIYTGSRNTFMYLAAFLIINTYYNFKKGTWFFYWLNFFGALLLYAFLQWGGVVALIFLPIIIYPIYLLMEKFSLGTIKYITIASAFLSISALVFISANSFDRIKNISWQLGVLQERLVYFQDAIKHILKHPLGSGINTFAYLQYSDQTAFYDVRYIHNSLLQTGYDLGIAALFIFLAIGIYGAILIYKSKKEDKKFILPLYLIIYLHSLLDFDFSYATITIILVALVAISTDDNNENLSLKIPRYITTPLLILGFYLITNGSLLIIGDSFASDGNYGTARQIYGLVNNITFKNPDCYSRIAQTYIKEGRRDNSIKAIVASVDYLKLAEKINPGDPKLSGNLAFANESLGGSDATIKYYKELIQKEKYYYKFYQFYDSYLSKKYLETKDSKYELEGRLLRQIYYDNLKSLNSKAKYMKDQLPASYEEMLKLK